MGLENKKHAGSPGARAKKQTPTLVPLRSGKRAQRALVSLEEPSGATRKLAGDWARSKQGPWKLNASEMNPPGGS